MVRGDTADEAVTPFVVAEGVQVAGVQVSGCFRNVGADGLLLFGGGQRDIGGYAVTDCAVATGSGEGMPQVELGAEETCGTPPPCRNEHEYRLPSGTRKGTD